MNRISIALLVFAWATSAAGKDVTWTGWFSDLHCATARHVIAQGNPDCAETCIQKGEPPAFISEQAKAIFRVKDSRSVLDDLGYRVEVRASVDEAAGTVVIHSVKHISDYQGPACARPRKSNPK